jgi:hypothetical protein
MKKLFFAGFLLVMLISSCSKKDSPSPSPTPTPVPGCASNTNPSNGTIFTSSTTTLNFNWSAVSGATAYDLYLGTSAASASVIASNITGTSHTMPMLMTPSSETYYWYVKPKNSSGTSAACSPTATSFTFAVIQSPAAFGYYVVGYFPSYRNLADVPDIKFRMTNCVVYSFYTVNSSGDLAAPSSPAATLTALRDKARTNNAKVFLGINDGSGDGKTYFKNMATTAGEGNIKQIMNTVRANSLDRVDMDWEYPTDGRRYFLL